jgi:hypothetical protein
MNPIYFYIIMLVLAAAAMLRLGDRGLVRVLGGSSVLTGVPVLMFVSGALNWRTELGASTTVLGYALAATAGIGAIFLGACALSAVLRLVVSAVRALLKKKL